MTTVAIVFAIVVSEGIGIDMLVQLLRRRAHRPNYQLIHRLEYELGFRKDPPAVTPEWWDVTVTQILGPSVEMVEFTSFGDKQRRFAPSSPSAGLWQIAVPHKMTAAQFEEVQRRLAASWAKPGLRDFVNTQERQRIDKLEAEKAMRDIVNGDIGGRHD